MVLTITQALNKLVIRLFGTANAGCLNLSCGGGVLGNLNQRVGDLERIDNINKNNENYINNKIEVLAEKMGYGFMPTFSDDNGVSIHKIKKPKKKKRKK